MDAEAVFPPLIFPFNLASAHETGTDGIGLPTALLADVQVVPRGIELAAAVFADVH
jgi:hypothetical protein